MGVTMVLMSSSWGQEARALGVCVFTFDSSLGSPWAWCRRSPCALGRLGGPPFFVLPASVFLVSLVSFLLSLEMFLSFFVGFTLIHFF